MSNNQNKCIGKCYDASVPQIHPITLEHVMHNKPYCPIQPIIEDKHMRISGNCNLEYNEVMQSNKLFSTREQKSTLLTPYIIFNPFSFMSDYYEIKTLNDFYSWLSNNKNAPVFTKMRLIDCFILSFGNDVNVVDDIFNKTIIDVIKKFWIKKMYRKLCSYVHATPQGACKLIEPSKNKLKKSDNVTERTKFLLTLITPIMVSEISNIFFSTIRTNDGIAEFYDTLVNGVRKKIQNML